MPQLNPFSKVLGEVKAAKDVQSRTARAASWLKKIGKGAVKSGASTLLNGRKVDPRSLHRSVLTELIGNMYLFRYDAHGKDTLPYWDASPLVIPIDLTPDGFLGINFHYLGYLHRALLLDRLRDFNGNQHDRRRDISNVSYSKINAISRYKYFRPALKRYKFDGIQSQLLEVHEGDWEMALFLPIHDFRGSSARTVWSNSAKQY